MQGNNSQKLGFLNADDERERTDFIFKLAQAQLPIPQVHAFPHVANHPPSPPHSQPTSRYYARYVHLQSIRTHCPHIDVT